jgi:hypothetical protein
MVQWADLDTLYGRFSRLGSSRRELEMAINQVTSVIAGVEADFGKGAP